MGVQKYLLVCERAVLRELLKRRTNLHSYTVLRVQHSYIKITLTDHVFIRETKFSINLMFNLRKCFFFGGGEQGIFVGDLLVWITPARNVLNR